MTDLTAERAAAWAAAAPPSRRSALPAVLAWLLVIVLTIALSPEGGCTPEDPCGTDWFGALEVVPSVAAPLLLLLWRPLGVVVSLLGVAAFAATETLLGDFDRWLSVGGPLLVAATTLELLLRQRAARLASDELARSTALSPVPGDRPELVTWTPLRLGGAVLLGLAVVAGLWSVRDDRHERALERQATRTQATVVAHGDDGYLVTVLVGDRRRELDTARADDYPVGSTPPVLLLDDGEVRLVAEPHDASGWLAGGLALALLGALLVGRDVDRHGRTRRLLAEPQPVHRARVVGTPEGAQLLPTDSERSLLRLDLVLASDDEDGPDLESRDDQDGPRGPVVEGATVYGRPVRGEALAVVLDDGTRLLPDALARDGQGDWRASWVDLDVDRGDDLEDESAAPGEAPPMADPAELAAWRERLTRQPAWRRPLGAVFVVGALVGTPLALQPTDSAAEALWRCAIAAAWLFNGLSLLCSTVRLNDEGLVNEGPTARRTVPWAAVEGVTVLDDVVLVRTQDDVVPLTWLRLPGRKRSRQVWAQRWAAVLADEAARRHARGLQQVVVEPRLAGAVAAVALVAAAVLGLALR